MKVLVTGAGGRLGSAIVRYFADHADVLGLSRADLDISDATGVRAVIDHERPNVVVNCAAYNDVDRAEDCPLDALRINAVAVRTLADASLRSGAVLVHYGSDFVFEGATDRVHGEEDEPAPQSVYGLSKLLGEWYAMAAPRYYVLRLASVFGGDDRRSRIDHIAEALRRREPPRVFSDRSVTPSYAPDVACATWRLIATTAPAGLYHCVNSGATNWLALAHEIARQIEVAPEVIPVSVASVVTRARRPQYAALANTKLVAAGIPMPAWQDALRRHLSPGRIAQALTG